MTTTPRQEGWTRVTANGPVSAPTALRRLFVDQGHSSWPDHLDRDEPRDGTLTRMVPAATRRRERARDRRVHVRRGAANDPDNTAIEATASARRLHPRRLNLLVAIPGVDLGETASVLQAHPTARDRLASDPVPVRLHPGGERR